MLIELNREGSEHMLLFSGSLSILKDRRDLSGEGNSSPLIQDQLTNPLQHFTKVELNLVTSIRTV